MKLTHVRLLVDRFRECFVFYRDVIGLETSFPEHDGPYAEFNLGDDRHLGLFDRSLMDAAIGEAAGRARGADVTALIFHVDDPDAEARRLRGLGVPLLAEPTDRPQWGERTVHVRDPDGNIVELYKDIPMEG
ncbi:MAG: VOC family protein [Actinomycetota bacterium]